MVFSRYDVGAMAKTPSEGEAAALHKDAMLLLKQGQRPLALPLLERVLLHRPHDLTLRQTVADLNAQLGMRAKAVAHYARAVEDFALLGKSMQAMALCRRILELDPHHADTQERLAELFAKGEPPKDAADFWEEPTAPSFQTPPPLLDLQQFRTMPPPPPPDAVDDWEPLEGEEPTVVPDLPKAPLPRIPLFSSLSPREFVAVLEGAVEAKAFEQGELILHEGDSDDAMFALVQGAVSVERVIDGQVVSLDRLFEGDVFGEVALLAKVKRTATVRAVEPTVVLRFERASMQAVMEHSPQVAKTVDDFCRARLLANYLRASPLFGGLSPAERTELRHQFEPMTAKAGQVLVEAGLPQDAVFLIVRGRCSVEGVHFEKYPDLVEGDSFGEISVMRQIPATATVTAQTDCLLLRLPRAGALTSALQHPAVKPLVDRVISERLSRTDELLGWRDGR